jgi:hypothetical protein
VEIWRRPILAGGLACDGGRYHTTFFWGCVHIRCCGHGHLGFRPYGGSLWKSAKVSKALLPHHSVPRLGSACPQSGIAPWARRDRPSLAVSRLPRHPCRGAHCAIPACGHRGLTGRLRSRSKARSKAEQQQQQCQGRSCIPPLWELACLRWRCISQYIYRLIHRHRRQASSHRGTRTLRRSGRL